MLSIDFAYLQIGLAPKKSNTKSNDALEQSIEEGWCDLVPPPLPANIDYDTNALVNALMEPPTLPTTEDMEHEAQQPNSTSYGGTVGIEPPDLIKVCLFVWFICLLVLFFCFLPSSFAQRSNNNKGIRRITRLTQLKDRSTWKELARGGTSIVYKAESTAFPVAVKHLDSLAPQQDLQKLQDLLGIILHLKHPNIVNVYVLAVFLIF
jgi:hypothetical protein